MTGPDRATRDRVRQRCRDCCELCGLLAVAGQIHHRRPRGMGGSSDPALNRPSNLVLLCWDCHRFVEQIQRRAAYEYGWLVPSGIRPDLHPFLLWGRWVLLTDAGAYVEIDEPDAMEPF